MANGTGSRYHHSHHPGYTYPVHLHARIYGTVIVPTVIVIVTALVVAHSPLAAGGGHISLITLVAALLVSLLRLAIAYTFALLLALPLALLINRNSVTERLLLPLFDVLQSVPVLAFFPAVIIFFVNAHFLEGAAVFIVFITMLWSIVFSLVGGLRQTPPDISAAARLFRITGPRYLRRVLVPSLVPYLVTGSLLAWAAGWNILIVAEVLHTYLPHSSQQVDLFGIGSVMVHASASGHSGLFIVSIVTMVAAIAALNFFAWQPLLRYAERFRYE